MNLKDIPIEKINPNEYNPNEMNESTFNHLKKEYNRIGYLQPILVRPVENDEYEIVDGEHRYKAGKKIGLKTLKCIVKEMTEEEAKITTINMNDIKGTDNPVKKAELIVSLNKQFEAKELSELLNKSETEIMEQELLVNLPESEDFDELTTESEPEIYEITLSYIKQEEINIIKEALDKAKGKDPEQKMLNISKHFIKQGDKL